MHSTDALIIHVNNTANTQLITKTIQITIIKNIFSAHEFTLISFFITLKMIVSTL